MKRNFMTGMVVGIFVSVLIFGVLNTRAAAKKGEEVEGIKQEEMKASKEEKKEGKEKEEEAKDEKKTAETKKTPAAATKKQQTAVKTAEDEKPKQIGAKTNIKSTEVVDKDVSEYSEEENVKVIYKTPETCKEFTVYLDDLSERLKEKERSLKQEEKLLAEMKERMEGLTKNYLEIEERIKKIVQYDPSNLKDNPQLDKMVRLYESFSPEEAAARLTNLDLDMTLAILRGMQAKKLGKILSAMDPKLSAALSSRIVRGF
ncbi:MAG: hypothetical protein HQM16_02370 [Deltaproteobacteria bacterium]|nr:hypothetical protein [Deltaproteobacteria bacterium]